MKKRLLTMCSPLLFCTLVLGQTQSGPPSPPTPAQMAAHEVSFLTQLLSLNSEQQSQATTILTNKAAAQGKLHSSLESARKTIEAAIEANDAGGISTAATQIGELTGQQVQAEATARAALYAILTADQQTKFKTLSSHGPGFGPHGGMGRPGMPPPPPPMEP